MSLQEALLGSAGLLTPPQRQRSTWSFETGGGIDEETSRRARLYEGLLVDARNEALQRRAAIEGLEAGPGVLAPTALVGTASTGRIGVPPLTTPATPMVGRAQDYLDLERAAAALEAGAASFGPSYLAGTAATGRPSIPRQAMPATPVVARAQDYLDRERAAAALEAPAAVASTSPLTTTAATSRPNSSVATTPMQRSISPAELVAEAAAAVTPEVVARGSWYDDAAGQARKAGNRLLEAVNPFRTKDGKIAGIRGGRVAGAGTILSLLAAANELNDPTESAGRNLAQAVGVGGGGVAGGLAGAAIGQTLIPIPGVGALVGATLGGMLGTDAGRGLASFAADLVQGSPEDRALAQYRKQQQAVTQAEVDKLNALLPIQERAAALQLQNRGRQLEQDSEQRLNDAVVAAMLRQQDNNRMLAAQLTEGILGGGGLV